MTAVRCGWAMLLSVRRSARLDMAGTLRPSRRRVTGRETRIGAVSFVSRLQSFDVLGGRDGADRRPARGAPGGGSARRGRDGRGADPRLRGGRAGAPGGGAGAHGGALRPA